MITVHPYNSDWPKAFNYEANAIRALLGAHCVAIHHIGSTSIPGIAAKKDIDILCIVDDLHSSLTLTEHGFIFKGEINIPLRYFFSKKSGPVNLHVVEAGHGFIPWQLAFRDYLRTHDDVRDAYGLLKMRLASDTAASECVQNLMPRYTCDKSPFILNVMRQANFDAFTYYFAFHKDEWEACQRLLGRTVEPRLGQHLFTLKKGADVVACALVETSGEFKILEIVADNNTHAYEEYLKEVIKKWARVKAATPSLGSDPKEVSQGITSIA